jgi:hypothetical protein
MNALLASLAFAFLSYAMFISRGHYHPHAILLVCISFCLAIAAAMVRASANGDALGRKLLRGTLLALVLGQLVCAATIAPVIYLRPGVSLLWFRVGLACVAGGVIGYALNGLAHARARLFALLLIYVALGVFVIRASPRPHIDVWLFQQAGTRQLLHGGNPYTHTYPNIYENEHSRYYSNATLRDGGPPVPYPPLTFFLSIFGRLIGDVRYSLLLATALAAWLMVRLARAGGLRAGHPVELAPLALLFHPRSFFMLEQAWTEPYVALFACATAFAIARGGRAARVFALAGLFSSKQYTPLFIPALCRLRAWRWRDVAVACAIAAALALPFFFWNPAAFVRGVVTMQFQQPFRADALSLLAAVFDWRGVELSSAIGFVAAGLAAAAVVWRADGTLAAALLGTAVICFAFFLFNKQAFFNYYWLVEAQLALGVVAATVALDERNADSARDRREGCA